MPSSAGYSAPPYIYTLSLHDALPIYSTCLIGGEKMDNDALTALGANSSLIHVDRSEEHTSELQSLRHLVCRLLRDILRPPISTLFPYTTLFRSIRRA